MKRIDRYNEYLLEKEFKSIVANILLIVETQTSTNTFEWDLTKPNTSVVDKLKTFLSKLPKEKVKEYFLKFLKDTVIKKNF